MSRKLDAAIAEALGKQIYTWSKINNTGARWGNSLFRYSTDGNAMLELDREMLGRGWFGGVNQSWSMVNGYRHVAIYAKCDINKDIKVWGSERVECIAETEPLARALAAYKALTGKEWEEG